MANPMPKTKANNEPYRKVKITMWDDPKFRALSPLPPSGQSLFIYLLTGPFTGIIPGLFKAGRAALAEELNWDVEAFDLALGEAITLGLVKADLQARVFWLPNAAKHNPPASKNVIKSWAKAFGYLPESPIKWEAWESLRAACYGTSETMGKAFDEALPLPLPTDKPTPLPSPIQKAVNSKQILKPKKHMSDSGKPPNQTPPPEDKKYPAEFETLWREYPKRSGSAGKSNALKAWQARRREGIQHETMLAAVRRYHVFCAAEGTLGTRFVRLAQTFLGPGHEFDNPWEVNPGGGGYAQNIPGNGKSIAEQQLDAGREQWLREQSGRFSGMAPVGPHDQNLQQPLDCEEWQSTLGNLGAADWDNDQ
jgi:hypothetical protein